MLIRRKVLRDPMSKRPFRYSGSLRISIQLRTCGPKPSPNVPNKNVFTLNPNSASYAKVSESPSVTQVSLAGARLKKQAGGENKGKLLHNGMGDHGRNRPRIKRPIIDAAASMIGHPGQWPRPET